MNRAVWLAIIVVVGLGTGTGTGTGISRAQEASPLPKVWAVVVSVENYPDPIADRAGSSVEGRRLANWVRGKAGWDSNHVLILNDDGNPAPPADPKAQAIPLKPTRKNLDWAIEQWLGSRVEKGDVVVLSFTGRGIAAPGGEVLLPIDAKGGKLESGWSPERGIERLLRDYKCSAVLSWIDAPVDHPDLPEGKLAGDQLLNRLARWPGSSVWLATGETPGSNPFGVSLRAALGTTPRTLLSSLATINEDQSLKNIRFRQKGGVPPDLTLFRDGPRRPQARRPEPLIQKGHASAINAMAVTADGKTMVSSSDDSTIRVWSTTDRDKPLLRVFPDFLNGVTALAISPGGRFLVGGDGMGDLLVWDLADPDPTPIIPGAPKVHGRRITALAFLPDIAPAQPEDDDEPPQAKPDPRPSTEVAPTARFVSIGQEGRCETWTVSGRSLTHSTMIPTGAQKLAASTRAGSRVAFALIDDKGKLHTYDRDSKPTRKTPIALEPARWSALHVDADGRRAATGDSRGNVRVLDLINGTTVLDLKADPGADPGAISTLRLGPGNRLAIGDDDGLSLVALDQPGPNSKPQRLTGLRDTVVSAEFSSGGTWLGACTKGGDLAAWKLVDGQSPALLKLERVGPNAEGATQDDASALAFGPESVAPLLAVGENDGGIRCWDLATLKQMPRIAPHRGKVRRLSTTPDGRSLLQITDDALAQVWDLQEGREVRTLPGLWASGAFLPDGRLALARHPNAGGGLALVDARTGRELPGIPNNSPQEGDYSLVIVSKDGRKVAASTTAGRPEEVHVWDLATGKVVIINGHKDKGAVTALDFSKDGRTLMTASRDGSVKLWDLSAIDPAKTPTAEYRDNRVQEMTAACLGPDGSGRVVAAGLSENDKSVVLSWNGKAGAGANSLGEFSGRTLTVRFLDDGRHVAAAGVDRQLRIWDLGQNPLDPAIGVKSEITWPTPGARHTERVNDLLPWPRLEANILATGSDDTTIRFWRIKPKVGRENPTYELLGTLTSAPDARGSGVGARGKGKPGADAKPVDLGPSPVVDAPWVAFTPDGVYDGSLDGDHLVTFGDGRALTSIDQYAERFFYPLLTDQIRRGIPTPVKPYNPPLPILLEGPEEQGPAQALAKLKVVLCDSSLEAKNIRLYHDDVPVRDGEGNDTGNSEGFQPGDRPGEFVASVTLKPGNNKFYAMVSRLNEADSRSSSITLFHSGPQNPGRMHVIALGVGDYGRNALRYAVKDARDLADYIQDHGVGTGKAIGQKVTLFDKNVTRKQVENAFEDVRKAVKGHPEDTVVVFLAGHTDILTEETGKERYSLLLPGFEFPVDAPAVAIVRGAGVGARARGPASKTFLPYSAIYRDITSFDALQRLVIVDACQAEAILNDPGVQVVQQLRAMDREARQSRTEYFLASRRGESALEAPQLEHGLLTYLLLRGMGASKLEKAPFDREIFGERKSADVDQNGLITTGALRRFVAQTLPELTDRLALGGVPRGAGEPAKPIDPATKTIIPPKTQAAGASFPLIAPPR